MRTVGVIGGMGPQATVLFMNRLIASARAVEEDEHVPLLVDQNPQVPSRIAHLIEGRGADPGPVLSAMAQRLETAGAEALVMPCNTAHHFAPAIRNAVAIPLLSMVEMAACHAARLVPGGSVGLLGSPALARAGVFDAPIAEQGLSVTPVENVHAVLATIRSIKAGGVTARTIEALQHEATAMANAGADVICICCTEFSLVAEEISAPVPVFDALDLLVEATIRFSREGTLPHVSAADAANGSNREKEVT